ncbi:MAG TPA: aldose epimerase family protein [Prolixibacteraceae bacterium]|mgnify:FL=1|jgi:aldose 1-epimerase|nr:aldose epimerase family protein [Prolixibacteraceae bacterium]
MKKLLGYLALAAIVFSCAAPKKEFTPIYSKADFEKEVNGKKTTLFTLKNEGGITVTLTNYGAKIVSVFAPDKSGNIEDVVLGYKSVDGYVTGDAGQGAVVGPYANRIANGQFEIDGQTYQLPVNNHKACLHSGPDSFYRQVYDAKEVQTADGPAVEMTLQSTDGQWGFPGNKNVKVTYTLTKDNGLKIDYEATTDKACYFNLTNHVYFNLKGEGMGDILDHVLVVDADKSTAVADSELIPTGEIVSIKGTAMDFTTPHTVGERINDSMEQLKMGGGYDHNYILNKDQNGHEMTFCASLYEPKSGRFMECFTTEPAVQLYSGNFLKGNIIGKRGNPYNYRNGICLETQHYPDSPHHPNFPNTLLKPGETLKSTTIYKFSVK